MGKCGSGSSASLFSSAEFFVRLVEDNPKKRPFARTLFWSAVERGGALFEKRLDKKVVFQFDEDVL